MDRKQQILNLRNKGFSYGSIASVFNISRQRVHQIFSGYITTTKRKRNRIKHKELNKLFKNIFKRDNCLCQKCGRMATLIHHIDNNWNNNIETNLISLCIKCHLNLHRPKMNKNKKGRFISKAY